MYSFLCFLYCTATWSLRLLSHFPLPLLPPSHHAASFSLLQGNSLAVGQVGQRCGEVQENGIASEDRQHLCQVPAGTTALINQRRVTHKVCAVLSHCMFIFLLSVLIQKLRKASQWTSQMWLKERRRKELEQPTAPQALLMVMNVILLWDIVCSIWKRGQFLFIFFHYLTSTYCSLMCHIFFRPLQADRRGAWSGGLR